MKATKYFMIPLLALLASGCQDEERSTVQPANGEEVKFDATLGQNTTRTIYGPESGDAFPIYWVNGDEVIVSSPECANSNGVGTANYKVTVNSETQNYATSLDKTSEIGVRWGENETASFYSVYPASGAELGGSDYSTVTLNMPLRQDCDIVEENGEKVVRPNMDACFMYAKTPGVKSGETVNLKYIPLSTAIRFKLQGPSEGNAVTVNSITLTAPAGVTISGEFNVNLASADTDGSQMPTATAVRGFNTVYITAAAETGSGYLTLGRNESIEMNAFLLLTDETPISNDWSIQIATSNGTFTKKLGGLSGGNMTLVPGKIHRLPDLPTLDGNAEWDPSDWMVNIPLNVYLSEISIPGSWNSLNSDSQKNTDIKAQYDAGIRAFHIDARWKATRWLFGYEVTGLGVAVGGSNNTYDTSDGKYMKNDIKTFEESLDEIIGCVKGDEYMVVICTFAQGSADHNRANGGWEKEISDICAKKGELVFDAKQLNQNTVVKDVLGSVIVIVNTENSVSIPDSKCLFMNMGMTLDQAEFTNNSYYQKSLTYGNNGLSGIDVYGTHAQLTARGNQGENTDRGYAPSLAERRLKGENILNWSQSNYDNLDNYAHNAWIYLGLGGYHEAQGLFGRDDHETVAKNLNSWINGKITEMDTNGYYPVGIVLMNNATNPEYSSNVAKNILLLNTKYRQAYDPDRSPITGEYLDGGSTMQSVAPGYSSGMIDNQTDAIGWTRIR